MALNRKYKIALIALLLLFVGVSVHAQYHAGMPPLAADSSYKNENVPLHPVLQQNWEKATKGLDYSAEKKKPKKEEKDAGKNSIDLSRFFSSILKWLPYLLFAIVIIGLIFLVIKVISSGLFLKNTAIKTSSSSILEDLEQNLHESDLDKALREALDKKDFRLALRIYYLAIIKELSLRNWIKWRKNKTNYEYVLELTERPQAAMFSDITLTFERAWYGDTVIDETSYNTLSPYFSRFMETIRNTATNG